MPEWIKDDNIWDKAIKAFGKEPKTDRDYAQITSIYKKMGGRIEGFENLLNMFKESINVDINIGDTVLTGKFKNKKTVVKDISTNERGEPTINGKNLLNVRMIPKEEKVLEPAKEDEVDAKELEIGIEVELEHTNDREEAKKIALQHLSEVPDYYTKLKKHVEVYKMNDYKERLEKLSEGYGDDSKIVKYKGYDIELIPHKRGVDAFIRPTGNKNKSFDDTSGKDENTSLKNAKAMIDSGNVEKERLERLSESVCKEELKVDSKYIQQLKQNNIDFTKVGDKLLVDESDSKVLDGLGIPYKESLSTESFKEKVSTFKMFTPNLSYQPGQNPERDIKKKIDEFNRLNKTNAKYISGKFKDDTKKTFEFKVEIEDIKKKKFADYNGFEESLSAVDKLYERVFAEKTFELSTDGIDKVYYIARNEKDAINQFKKDFNNKQPKYVIYYDSKDRKDLIESFQEKFTQQEVNLMSQLLQTLGFNQMAKDIKKVKTDEEFLKYLAVVRRDMVKRLSSNPDNKDKIKKVIDLTDKVAKSVQSRKESLSRLDKLHESVCKEAKDKNGKGIFGGARVKTPNGKTGYVYQIMNNEIRVTSKPQTGLIGWFKPEELEVKESLSRLDSVHESVYKEESNNKNKAKMYIKLLNELMLDLIKDFPEAKTYESGFKRYITSLESEIQRI